MDFSTIMLVVVAIVMLGMTGVFAFLMTRRQEDSLRREKKPVPRRGLIFAAGLLTVLVYMGAIAAALLMLLAPFLKIELTGTPGDTTNLLVVGVIALTAAGTGLYWLFVKLGLFSWKSFSSDN